MKKYIVLVTHAHEYGINTYIGQTDGATTEKLIKHFCIDYEPDKGETLDIDVYHTKTLQII